MKTENRTNNHLRSTTRNTND